MSKSGLDKQNKGIDLTNEDLYEGIGRPDLRPVNTKNTIEGLQLYAYDGLEVCKVNSGDNLFDDNKFYLKGDVLNATAQAVQEALAKQREELVEKVVDVSFENPEVNDPEDRYVSLDDVLEILEEEAK